MEHGISTTKTSRVAGLVQLLGHAAGGQPAKRLMTRLDIPTSDDIILRHLKRQTAALTPWSNGQADGQIARLKTRKREMYGRASIELLRARMLALQAAISHGDRG